MIKLHQFPPLWGLPSPSPFCLKVETYLRLTGLDYEPVYETDPRKAPKGKLPFIADGDKIVADSGLIIEHLKKTRGDPLDEGLDAGQRAAAHALRRLTEESLYWCVVYSRWIDPNGWPQIKAAFFSAMPMPLRAFVPNLIRKRVGRDLYAQGLGRHSREDVYAHGCADLTAISEILGDKPYMLGDAPASVDAAVYGLLATILLVPVDTPLKAHGLERSNLSAYCNRMREKCF